MGAQFSNVNDLKKNQYLKRLVDVDPIDVNDPFWNQLLSFTTNLPLTKLVLYFLSYKSVNNSSLIAL